MSFRQVTIGYIRLWRFDEIKEFSVTISKFNDHYLANYHEEKKESRYRELNNALLDAMNAGYTFQPLSISEKIK
jgi:hypothetical protein